MNKHGGGCTELTSLHYQSEVSEPSVYKYDTPRCGADLMMYIIHEMDVLVRW